MVMAIDFAERNRLGPQWLVNSKAVLAVGDGEQFFKIDSTGHIGFPFCRVDFGDQFEALIAGLNATLERPLFTVSDEGGKGRGGSLAGLWPQSQKFDAFLGVWNRFAQNRMNGRGHE